MVFLYTSQVTGGFLFSRFFKKGLKKRTESALFHKSQGKIYGFDMFGECADGYEVDPGSGNLQNVF